MTIDIYASKVRLAAEKHGVPYDLLRADAQHESGGDPLAIGDGGFALGLMQVHPGACKDIGGDWSALKAAIDAGDRDKAADLSLDYGAAYLARMLKLFNDERIALMAYNQGVTVINRAVAYADAVESLKGA